MHKYSLEMVTIFPGEYHATREYRIISTVLGSCIAVVMYDPVNGIGGMNHFMLPDTIDKEKFYLSRSGKYGMYAMELLIGELIKLGGNKKRFCSKVFGGGSVLHSDQKYTSRVPENNVKFAFEYLEAEKIPVLSSDVGGTEARRVLFFTEDAKTLVKRIAGTQVKPLESEELKYMKKIRKDRPPADRGVTIF